ncbi:MAG TPA: hypothetical protein VME23_04470, partial [Terracidiphilus sp.]|nr:hypothetical protein [Terracidiphilus sp.]
SNDSRVPTDSRNTAWKMVSLALNQLGTAAEVEIEIEKRLPVQGGLGAGSGNAVAALIGLERELGRRSGGGIVTEPAEGEWNTRRMQIAAEVGSDVPLFLIGGMVLGLDRGQRVHPMRDVEPTWCLIVVPEVGVSTPQAFRDWDALCAAEGLTAGASTDKLNMLSRAYDEAFREEIPGNAEASGSSGVLAAGEDLAARPEETIPGSGLVRTGITSWIENDFERVVFPQHPSLSEIKRTLAAEGTPEAALYASLSGSGSALYGLYLTREHAESACRRLGEMGIRTELTRTLPRAGYWRQMLSEQVD